MFEARDSETQGEWVLRRRYGNVVMWKQKMRSIFAARCKDVLLLRQTEPYCVILLQSKNNERKNTKHMKDKENLHVQHTTERIWRAFANVLWIRKLQNTWFRIEQDLTPTRSFLHAMCVGMMIVWPKPSDWVHCCWSENERESKIGFASWMCFTYRSCKPTCFR